MAPIYNFAVVRLAPTDGRDERLNIGALVFNGDGLDIRISRRLEKVRAISGALDSAILRELLDQFRELDTQIRRSGALADEQRHEILNRIGPVSLSEIGCFEARSAGEYEDRVLTIMKRMVDPEPALKRPVAKRSKLVSQIKREFRVECVLASKEENLESHRIVTGLEVDEGLIADFALKNGAMHVVETVDATEEESTRKVLSDIGIAALVLERARMKFGEDQTKARLVYSATGTTEKVATPALQAASNQGAKLYNWNSADDRMQFLQALAANASPIPRAKRKSAGKFVARSRLKID